MKYSEYHSKSKFTGSAAFYIVIACCLIAIGGASWFAAANLSKRDNSSKSEPYSSEAEAPAESNNTAVVFSMPLQGEIIKSHSEKELQYSATFGDMRIHTGLDIACEVGTSVSAAGDGKVLSVEESSTLGTVVTVEHSGGITTMYASLKDVKVKAGDKVSAGDIIGAVGTVPSECADQSHLHFEAEKNGHSADPLDVLGLE